jgi:uncharacterized protein (TIRG00374 family)
MSAPTLAPPARPARGPLVRGVLTFLLLSVSGLAALFALTFEGDSRQVLRSLSPGFLGLAAAGAALDLVIGAVRYQIFLRRIRPGTSLWLPIRADLANRFIGAVTPSQTGGGPAQVFVLWRGGIPVPDALSFLLVNFLCTLVFFLLAGGAAAWVFRSRFSAGAIRFLVEYAFVAFAACLAVMLVGLFRPDLIARPLAALAAHLRTRTSAWARVTAKACDGAVEGTERYRVACRRFIREAPLLPVASFLLTVVLYLNKFTLAWLVMRGLGVHGSYAATLAVQALLHFILYVAPSPGGSGIAELGTGALMSLLLPGQLLAPFTLAYRFFLLYLPATVGAFVMMAEVRPGGVPAGTRPRSATLLTFLALVVGARAVEAQSAPDSALETPAAIESIVVRGILETDPKRRAEAFVEAVTLARGAVEATPEDPDAYYVLAVALGYRLEHQGLRTKLRLAGEVRAAAERALELDPDHAGAHHVLGRLHAGAMRLNRIARVIARELLGASVLEGASWEEAEHHFSEARRLEPTNPRHAMELGALYLDTGRPELARGVLEVALSDPARNASDSLAVERARYLLSSLAKDGADGAHPDT